MRIAMIPITTISSISENPRGEPRFDIIILITSAESSKRTRKPHCRLPRRCAAATIGSRRLHMPENTPLQVGQPAPDFTLLNQDKNPVKLSDYRDKKKVMLLFYPMDFSPTCT